MMGSTAAVLGTLLLLAGDLVAQPPRDQRADALIDRWIEAAGGPHIWDAVRDLRYVVTTVWYDSATGRETRRRPRYVHVKKIPDGFRVRVERQEAVGRYVQVWDGRNAWATLDGVLLPDTAAAVREIRYVAGDLTYWPGLPWKLYDEGARRTYVDTSPVAPGPSVHVTFGDDVGLHPEDRFWYHFADPDSPFPTHVHWIEQGRTVRELSVWSDWQRLQPLPYVGTRLYLNEHGQRIKALLFSDMQPNRGVADALFRRPR